MPKMEVEHKVDQDQFDKVKEVIKENWKPFVAGVIFASIIVSRRRVVINNFSFVSPIPGPGPVLL